MLLKLCSLLAFVSLSYQDCGCSSSNSTCSSSSSSSGLDSLDDLDYQMSSTPGYVDACPYGWKLFNRSKGAWCIRTFSGVINETAAETRCAKRGAVLTSFETAAERYYVFDQGINQMWDKYNQTSGMIWIGMKRKPECSTADYASLTGCTGANAYYWTDGFTTGTAGTYWATYQPDFKSNVQTCVAMYLLIGVSPTGDVRYPGSFDDVVCDVSIQASLYQSIRGYACGKKADLISLSSSS
ncbi:unnamed protein product [Caenorhabditis angaria]|uniref:C-type lectin domain-containing protein n=1 Tax=Caenorhabditis angaria TaxID=860376 RepID=A0A9P1IHY4_9PELO|nr:unnamed protein product [Caenorhabditis angaria]